MNAAGVTRPVPHADLDGLDDDLIDRIFAVNWRGTFAAVRSFAPLLRANGEGLIVNVSSISATTAVGSNIAYCASKAGVDVMGAALARALAPAIRVLTVSPGVVDTDFRCRARRGRVGEDRRRHAAAAHRLGGRHRLGDPGLRHHADILDRLRHPGGWRAASLGTDAPMHPKVVITCAITGNLTRPDQTPYLPITPEQIAGSALEAAEAGAAVAHIHVRDPATGTAVHGARPLPRRDGPHPREKSRADHQSHHRAGRAFRAVGRRPESRRAGDHAGAPRKARRTCRGAAARHLHARSQHDEFGRPGGDQHAGQRYENGAVHPGRAGQAGDRTVRQRRRASRPRAAPAEGA